MNQNWNELKRIAGELYDLATASELLEWDQQVNMPEAGSDGRANQMALLSRMAHELAVSDRMGELLESLGESAKQAGEESDDAALWRLLRRDYGREKRVPSDYVQEFSLVTGRAFNNWARAKTEDRFEIFAPDLEKIFDMRREYAGFFGPYEHIYDPLLAEFEPDFKTADVVRIFDELRAGQVELIREIGEKEQIDNAFLGGSFAEENQWRLGVAAATRIGFDWKRGRLDRAEHPFTVTCNRNDVRITTHLYRDNLLSSLYSVLHEGGHAIYEQGVGASLDRMPTGTGASLSIHESQSRLWENLVGRSRAFLAGFYPGIVKEFPQFNAVPVADFYRAVNRVEPSLIRTEADEATYNLHIMLRMELEIAVLTGNLAVRDLPGAWREKMAEYLGVVPATDREGVLQDVHWAGGTVGYFPTYALGNVFSAQVWGVASQALPELDQQIERGDFAPLRAFLTDRIYRHGAKFTPAELIRRVTGGELDAKPYLAYLRRKFGAIYDL